MKTHEDSGREGKAGRKGDMRELNKKLNMLAHLPLRQGLHIVNLIVASV